MGADFEAALMENMDQEAFSFGGKEYIISTEDGSSRVFEAGEQKQVAYLTTYVFDAYQNSSAITDEFRVEAIRAAVGDQSFKVGESSYTLQEEEDEIVIYDTARSEEPFAAFSNLVVRAYSGEDTMEFAYKEKVREVVDEMVSGGVVKSSFEWEIPQLNENGEYEYDENGNLIKEQTEMQIENKNGSFVINCEQVNYLIDIYGSVSKEHWIGTDGDGMDVLARMMYG